MRAFISLFLKAAILLSLLNFAAFANPISPHWALIDSTTPDRQSFAAAYDALNNYILLFGGIDSSGQMPQDTWKWNGPFWQQVATTGPAGRANFGMCYVESQGFFLLFGGWSLSDGFLGDTWIWDGWTWTELNIAGPPARAYFAMAYDQSSQNVVLFGGGDDQTVFGDTWEWDGASWSLVDTVGPAPRTYSRMVSIPDYGGCYLFGGLAGSGGGALDDSWTRIGSAWVQLEGENPSPRMGHMMALSPYGAYYWTVELFGGQDAPAPNQYYDDTWEYDNSGWYLTDTGEPPARSLGEMVFDDSLQQVIVIGGTDGSRIFRDMWVYPVYYDPCSFIIGDVNSSRDFNGLDVTYAVAYLKGGPPPPLACECPAGSGNMWFVAGDVNGTCNFNGLDITYMVAYFKGGPTPMACPDCPPDL